jgi:Ca2+-binding EF-hand superfamily protein
MKRRFRKPAHQIRRRLIAEPLEARRVLAASFGWDGPGLGSAELTYTIGNAPSSLSQSEVDAAIETAFNAWANVADISFTEVSQTGLRDSIDISFTNIDGRGGTLAQAYFPDDVNRARIAGDIQFDLAEVWEVGNSQGNRAFDLAWVATHEIGHSLGLDHSRDSGSVLAAYVSPNQKFLSLDNDDVAQIRRLYASSAGTLTSDQSDEQTPVEEPAVTELSDPDTSTEPADPNDNDSNNNDNNDRDNNPFRRWRWRWAGFWWRRGGRVTSDTPDNHNLYAPTDANDDGSTSAVDALVIINHLNRDAASGAGFYDVNGDGNISAVDALMVINSLDHTENTQNGETLANEELPLGEPGETVEDEMGVENEVIDPVDDGGLPHDDADEESDHESGDDHDDARHHRHHRFGGGRLLRGNGDRLFTRFDTNENGAISEDELPERLWQHLVDKNIDTDSDGSITGEELDTYAADRRAERFARKDADESGSLTEDEVSQRFWDKVSPADTDQDGGVSLEELEIWLEERRIEIPEAENADEDCGEEEMDEDDSESGNLSLVQRRSDRLFTQLGRRAGRR